MPRNTTEAAALLAQFAQEHGLSLRAARNYRRDVRLGGKPRPAWVAWCRAKGKHCDGQAVGGGDGGDMNELEKARLARDNAYHLLRQLQKAAAAAGMDGDDTKVALMARGVRDAQRAWEQASLYADKLAEKAGVMIPVDRVRSIQRELVGPLGEALRSYRNNIASHLPPEWRPKVFAAFAAEARPLDDGIAAIDRRLERLLIC